MDTRTRTNILLVDDRDENLTALVVILEELGENLVVARSGTEALRQLMKLDFAVILLDVHMPGMSGFETASLIRSRAKWAATPIIFLTADDTDESGTFEGYRLGAVDFMQKPLRSEVLRAKVKVFVDLAKSADLIRRHAEELQAEIEIRKRLEQEVTRSEATFRAMIERSPYGTAVLRQGRVVFANPALLSTLQVDQTDVVIGRSCAELVYSEDAPQFRAMLDRVTEGTANGSPVEQRLVRSNGSVAHAELSAMPIAFDGDLCTLLIVNDVTEKRELHARMLELARTDHLTGLAVRRAGEESIEREVAKASRYGTKLSFALFDIDNFKSVNDSSGHIAGDRALRAVGNVLANEIRKSDVAIRWGGEELLVVLPHTDLDGAAVFAERVRCSIEALRIDDVGSVTISAGIAELGGDVVAERAIERADERLYEAKRSGRNRVC